MSEHPADMPDETPVPDADSRDRSGSAAARGAWMASGVAFFAVGVAFSFAMPDNFAMGITFLGLGVVFFSLAGTQRAPGDGPGGGAPDSVAADAAPDTAPDTAPDSVPNSAPDSALDSVPDSVPPDDAPPPPRG